MVFLRLVHRDQQAVCHSVQRADQKNDERDIQAYHWFDSFDFHAQFYIQVKIKDNKETVRFRNLPQNPYRFPVQGLRTDSITNDQNLFLVHQL
jgi:hypothetical protein